MIRRLRRKFILINLLLVGVVLTVVFVLLVASNARRYADQSQAAMRMALSWRPDNVSCSAMFIRISSQAILRRCEGGGLSVPEKSAGSS